MKIKVFAQTRNSIKKIATRKLTEVKAIKTTIKFRVLILII